MKNEVPIIKSIRTKLIFWICILFVFIGALIYFPLSNILPKMITSQILKRDVEIARFISNEAKEPLLTDNKVELSLLLNNNLDKLEDIHYLFIQSPNGSIISHTFSKGFPKGLLSFRMDSQQPYKINKFLNNDKKMYDIAFPILEGGLGVLHLGVSLDSDKKDIAQISKINYYVAVVILLGLGIGIIVFLTIGFLFSSKIIRLKNLAFKIGQGDLDAKIDVKSKDEIGTLASAFNEMVLHLKEKIREIKRLNTIEERNKIAFDLHDGCAQHAANIIKRIEFCEKLFKADPQKAFEELKNLKESARNSLNRTRHLISDLKLSDDISFSLPEEIKGYIIDYRKQTDLNVKLYIADSIYNIQFDNAKSIFHIISEALANIRKHSNAKNVKIRLDIDKKNNLTVKIEDDGKGFDLEKLKQDDSGRDKWGLLSMRKRAESLGGIFKITSFPGVGTKVNIDIPFILKTV